MGSEDTCDCPTCPAHRIVNTYHKSSHLIGDLYQTLMPCHTTISKLSTYNIQHIQLQWRSEGSWRPGARVENGAPPPWWLPTAARARRGGGGGGRGRSPWKIFTTKSRFRAIWALLSTILNTYFRDRVISLTVILTYVYYINHCFMKILK